MKKVLIGFALLALVLGFSGTASAALYFDFDCDGNFFNKTNETETWVFDLNNDNLWIGDVEENDEILSATLRVKTLAGKDCFLIPKTFEYATMFADDVTLWDKEEIDTGLFSFNVLDQVAGDHRLEVTIKNMGGDFSVCSLSLGGRYQKGSSTAPVPEPATLLLLGSGLLGVVRIGRKKMKKA